MSKRFHIKGFRKPVFATALLIWLTVGLLFGQNTVSLGGHLLCENQEILIPVNVTEFENVASFTFFIQIDTLAVKFLTIENPNAQLSGGGVLANFIETSSQIGITWFAMSGITITNGKLFDLHLIYHQSSTELVFTEACEITQADGTIIENVVYENGALYPAVQITLQPLPVTVTEGQAALFEIDLLYSENHQFQWQQNNGIGWNDLFEAPPFEGVHTKKLIIQDVPLEFNNNAFRCLINYDECAATSDTAILTVSSLSVVNMHYRQQLLSVFPNPFSDKLNYALNIPDQQFRLIFVNALGKVVSDHQPEGLTGSYNLENLDPGIYILQLLRNNQTFETVSLLKR